MSEASKIIQTKVNNEFNRQVDELAEEVTDKIIKQRDLFRGYDSSEYFLKRDLDEIFSENASCSQYGSPPILKLGKLITALITRVPSTSGRLSRNSFRSGRSSWSRGVIESVFACSESNHHKLSGVRSPSKSCNSWSPRTHFARWS